MYVRHRAFVELVGGESQRCRSELDAAILCLFWPNIWISVLALRHVCHVSHPELAPLTGRETYIYIYIYTSCVFTTTEMECPVNYHRGYSGMEYKRKSGGGSLKYPWQEQIGDLEGGHQTDHFASPGRHFDEACSVHNLKERTESETLGQN